MVERLGHDLRQLCRQGKGCGLTKLKRCSVVIVQHLRIHSFGNFLAAVATGDIEQTGRAVNQLVAILVPQIHALASGNQARRGFELAICGERHPVLFQRVGDKFLERFHNHIHDFILLCAPGRASSKNTRLRPD